MFSCRSFVQTISQFLLTTTLALETLLRVDGTGLVVGLQDVASTTTGRVATRALLLLLAASRGLGAGHLTGSRLGGRSGARRGSRLRCRGRSGRRAVLYAKQGVSYRVSKKVISLQSGLRRRKFRTYAKSAFHIQIPPACVSTNHRGGRKGSGKRQTSSPQDV